MATSTNSIICGLPQNNNAGGLLVDARDFGINPGSSHSMTSALSTALNAAAANNTQLLLQPGTYNYDNIINVTGGGGIVCHGGRAKLNAQSPTYDLNAISFTASGSPYIGFRLENIDFDNVTRPSSGLTNDAPENAHFIRLTNIHDVYVNNNKVIKNYGGFILLRNVEDARITNNVCKDLWKDVFHTTDASKNIWRTGNVVIDCGDDAFATVGYIYRGVRPEYIYDLNNYVYGCRKARAFAYVGCANVKSYNFVDGRVMEAPQITSTDGYYFGGNCALYIGSEYLGVGSTYNTYGVDNIEAHVDAQHMRPIVTTPGGAAVAATGQYGINSFEAVHIVASGQPHSNVKVTGTLTNISKGGVFVGGADGTTDLDLDVVIKDNTDPDGWRGTAGTYAKPAVEVQYLRGESNLSADISTCNTIPFVVGNTNSGDISIKLKVNDVCKTVVHDILFVDTSAPIDNLDIDLDIDWDIGSGKLDFLLDLGGTTPLANSCNLNLHGKGSVDNVTALVRGAASTRSITLTGSPQILVNPGDDDVFLQIKGGTLTSLEQSRILTHHARPVASVAGNVLTIAGDVSTLYTTARHCVFLSSGAQFDMTQAIAISSVSFSAGNTSVTLASAPPASNTYTRVAPLYTDGFVSSPGSARRFIKVGKNRAVRVTYSSTPTVNVISSRQ